MAEDVPCNLNLTEVSDASQWAEGEGEHIPFAVVALGLGELGKEV